MPHASCATESHERPSRDFGALPSFTRITTLSMVTTSSTPRLMVPRKNWLYLIARAPIAKPATLPSTCIRPTSADASPTWCAGTRSGT